MLHFGLYSFVVGRILQRERREMADIPKASEASGSGSTASSEVDATYGELRALQIQRGIYKDYFNFMPRQSKTEGSDDVYVKIQRRAYNKYSLYLI